MDTVKDADTFKNVHDLFVKPIDEIINSDISTYRNNISEVQECMGDIHKLVRKHYATAINKMSMNIYPLIVASETGTISEPSNVARQGIGGVYTLYKSKNEVYKCSPVHPVYELLKISSHLVIGLFVIIEPFLKLTTENKGTSRVRFFKHLQQYYNALKIAMQSFKTINNNNDITKLFHDIDTKNLIITLMKETIKYTNDVLVTKEVNQILFVQYSNKIKPMIAKCMQLATDLQTRDTITMLLKWKSMMSDEEWKNLYVIIPTIWVVTKNNPREQIFRFVMDKQNQSTHIICGENLLNQEEARLLLGRIVHDRLMSRFVFGIKDIWSQRKCQGLGSQQDSLSDYCAKSIQKYVDNQCKLKSKL